MNQFNSHRVRQVLVILILVGIVFSCIDGDLLTPDLNSPVIIEFSPVSGLPGTTVTIRGENFNGSPGLDSVFVNGYGARVISSNQTQLEIIVPDEATTGPIVVTELVSRKRAVSSSDFEVLEVGTPGVEISKVTPTAGVAGSSFSISGKNFGEEVGDITVRIGIDTVLVNSINDTLIVAVVPVSANTGLINIIKEGTSTIGPEYMVLEMNPVIDSLKPVHGPIGAVVWIIGRYFSTVSDQNTISFNGASAIVTEAYNDSLKTKVPSGATTGKVTVTVNGRSGEWPLFTVDPTAPVITDIDPKSGKTGITVTISGKHFSEVPEENTVTFNGEIAAVSSATDSELEVIVPDDATTGPVQVTVNGLTATGPQFAVESSDVKVSSINPTSGQVGISVTITGENFGATPTENMVTFNGVGAQITSASTTQIVAIVPMGATSGPVAVTVGGVSGIGPDFTVQPTPPQITSINPNAGQIGSSVKIVGTNFGSSPGDNAVTFNGTNAAVTSASTTELTAEVPGGATSGPVIVTVGGLASNAVTFTVEPTPPSITSLDPNAGQVGSVIKIIGTNFSATPSNNIVTFNGINATVSNASTTELTVSVPVGATTGPVVVTVGGLSSNAVNFTVEPTPPSITSLDPNAGQVGTSIKILGTNFSSTPSNNIVTFNGTNAIVTNASTVELTVAVPTGATTGPVIVTVGGLASNAVNFTVEPTPPSISSLNPNAGQVGSSIKIIGTNFNATPANNVVTFNGTNANVNGASTTELTVTVPAGATTGPVIVSVGGLISNAVNFTVEPTPPQITSINPSSGPYNTEVTITGTNFSDVDSENTVFFNGKETVINSASSTAIVAVVPLGAGSGAVSVTTNGLTDVGPNFNYIKTAFVNTYAGNGTAGFVNGPGGSAQFNGPARMAAKANGEIVLADFNNHSIRLINTKGQVSTIAGDGASGLLNGAGSQARFARPLGVAIDNAGNIYVADFDNHVIRQISTSNVVSTHAGTGQPGFDNGNRNIASFNGPVDIAIDGIGNLYVADLYNHAIRKIDVNGNVTVLAGSGTPGYADLDGTKAAFNNPTGLGIDNSNNILVADLANHAIRSIDGAGNVTSIAGNGTAGSTDGPINSARFRFPYDVDVDANGNIYVADDKNHKIRIIQTNNTVSTLAGSGTEGFMDGLASDAQFNDPTGVLVISNELIYVGDTENNRVRVITFE